MLDEFRAKKEAELKTREEEERARAEAEGDTDEGGPPSTAKGPDYGTPGVHPMAEYEMDRSLLKEVTQVGEALKTVRPEVRVLSCPCWLLTSGSALIA